MQDVLINLEIAAMYADADAVVKSAEGRILTCKVFYESYIWLIDIRLD